MSEKPYKWRWLCDANVKVYQFTNHAYDVFWGHDVVLCKEQCEKSSVCVKRNSCCWWCFTALVQLGTANCELHVEACFFFSFFFSVSLCWIKLKCRFSKPNGLLLVQGNCVKNHYHGLARETLWTLLKKIGLSEKALWVKIKKCCIFVHVQCGSGWKCSIKTCVTAESKIQLNMWSHAGLLPSMFKHITQNVMTSQTVCAQPSQITNFCAHVLFIVPDMYLLYMVLKTIR